MLSLSCWVSRPAGKNSTHLFLKKNFTTVLESYFWKYPHWYFFFYFYNNLKKSFTTCAVSAEKPAVPLVCFLIHKVSFPLQSSSVAQSCLTLCDPMDRSTPGLPVHHQLPEFAQTHVHWVGDAIQPSHPLSSPSPPAFNLSQHQGLFHSVSSLHQVAKVLEFQLQHQSFQWIFRNDFL